MVCTTQPPRGCTPVPPSKNDGGRAKTENYALLNEQLRQHTIYVYVRTRAREASGREKLKNQKPRSIHSFFVSILLPSRYKLNIISIPFGPSSARPLHS